MITVWGRENSTNVKKVLWCLEELELPYNRIPAGGKYGINHDADYLEMNPNGLVPCLRDDETGLVLWESNTIVRYLAAQYGRAVCGWKAPLSAPVAKNGWTGPSARCLRRTAASSSAWCARRPNSATRR